eukprot:699206-Amphidinium_carterae.1
MGREPEHVFFVGCYLSLGAVSPCGSSYLHVAGPSYVGVVRRGDPRSLKLVALPLRYSKARAPGPGPMTSATCAPITEGLKGKSVVLHTDSASAYKAQIDGVVHTSVVHPLKKIKGIWVHLWAPTQGAYWHANN